MKQEIATLWVAALRSGKYTQATKALKSEAGHCCLGVLCELYHEQTGLGRWERDSLSHFSTDERDSPVNVQVFFTEGDSTAMVLPRPVANWAQMTHLNGTLIGEQDLRFEGRDYASLAEVNDAGYSFLDIAATIEENVANL